MANKISIMDNYQGTALRQVPNGTWLYMSVGSSVY